MKDYLRFIRADNADRHVENKLSMLRRFIGTERVDRLAPAENTILQERRLRRPSAPFFTGEFLDEITVSVLQTFFEEMPVGIKTKRHYREFFQHFFGYCIKAGLYRPPNPHCPNPTAVLPSYLTKDRVIVFLSSEEVAQQLRALEFYPSFRMAVALMIFAGLRRAEALWLTRDAIAPDLSFLSVVNRHDHDNQLEKSTLKTGQRAVTILPPLRKLLAEYLQDLKGDWLVPSPMGKRWNGDAFGKRLRAHNEASQLAWNCLHYRHTYATQRSAEGWTLFRIAHEMGNSVAVVEEYYAAYIRPADVGVPMEPLQLQVVNAA